jgi:hypothetical protein
MLGVLHGGVWRFEKLAEVLLEARHLKRSEREVGTILYAIVIGRIGDSPKCRSFGYGRRP